MFSLIDTIIIRPIVNILFIIYNYIGDFGVAIIIFTVLVKICMWPLVKRQLNQTKQMRKIQPELAEIKKNAKGNRQLESIQTLELYKRHNVKPLRSFLTILIQLPIFFALYGAISCMVLPTESNNVSTRAYEPIAQLDRIDEIVNKQNDYLKNLETDSNATYDFHPQIFGLVNLDTTANSVFSSPNIHNLAILSFCIISAFVQFWMTRQTALTNEKKGKKKTFRQMMKDAENGIEPDQADLTAMTTRQMSLMMPLMMFIIMFNLPGALVFYFLINNIFTVVQQHFVLNKKDDNESEKSESAEKSKTVKTRNGKTAKSHKKNKKAEVIENKKTGTKITRITAKDSKRK